MSYQSNRQIVIQPNSAEVRSMIPEEYVRIREEEMRAEAERQRRAQRLLAGRLWRSLAGYATRRAEAAERR
ncbi:hypothetical protein [Saccharopolyspora griseoalba]|uniref:Uncharacterized protein n=1 Tax=Saccharopolyspora griseoalba TaxID=1431848 RepID=A0ABW2LKQ6_9PSEU